MPNAAQATSGASCFRQKVSGIRLEDSRAEQYRKGAQGA